MKASRALWGVIAAVVSATSLFVVPSALAGPPDTKVTFCHRTGSETNPYVVITTALSAWQEAHNPTDGSHPALNGRDDFQVPPGTKKGDCENSGEGGGGQ